MKALKATISGSYKTPQGDIIDFEDVSGVIPLVDEAHAFMHIKSRYSDDWVRAAVADGKKLYTDRIEHMREVFMDEMKETEHDFSYVGKDIKHMTYDELQDLATAKDLRYIPLPKRQSGFSLREARVRAYIVYSEKVMNNVINENDEDFSFAELPSLIVDGGVRKEVSKKITNEEIINQEQNNAIGKPKDNLTLEDLKDVADKKNIKYHWNIGFDKLYALLYGNAPA